MMKNAYIAKSVWQIAKNNPHFFVRLTEIWYPVSIRQITGKAENG